MDYNYCSVYFVLVIFSTWLLDYSYVSAAQFMGITLHLRFG